MVPPLLLVSPILSFLKRYWLPVAIVVVLITGGAYLYWKGGANKAVKLEKEAYRDVIERTERGLEDIERGRKFREKVDESRRVDPVNDDRSSCLLSSNNPREECAKYL